MTAALSIPAIPVPGLSDPLAPVHPAKNSQEKQSDTSHEGGFSDILTNILSEHSPPVGNSKLSMAQQAPVTEGHDLPPDGNISPLSINITLAEDSQDNADSGKLVSVTDEQQIDDITPGNTINNISSQLATEVANNQRLIKPLDEVYHLNKVISHSLQRATNGQIGEITGENIPVPAGDDDSIADLLTKGHSLSDSGLRPAPTINNSEQYLRQVLMSQNIDKYSDKDTSNKLIADSLKIDPENPTGVVTSLGSNNYDNRALNHFTLPQPVTNPQWKHDFNDRVRWLIGNQVQKAELTLHPRSMGAIEISISLHNDQTSIHIVAQNPIAKDAVDNSIGRLREMLGEAGINLADVDVSQHSGHDSTASERDKPYYADTPQTEDPVAAVQVSQQLISDNYSLIDFYA